MHFGEWMPLTLELTVQHVHRVGQEDAARKRRQAGVCCGKFEQ